MKNVNLNAFVVFLFGVANIIIASMSVIENNKNGNEYFHGWVSLNLAAAIFCFIVAVIITILNKKTKESLAASRKIKNRLL